MARRLRIDSALRTSAGDTPADFEIALTGGAVLPAGDYALVAASIPHTAAPVPAGSELRYTVSGSDGAPAVVAVVATEGDVYTVEGLVAELKARLDSTSEDDSRTWTVALDPDTHRLSFSHTGDGAVVTLNPGLGDSSQSPLAPALGIYKDLKVPSDGATTVEGQGTVDLSFPAYLLHVEGAVGETILASGLRPTFVVPCTANSFEVVDWPSSPGGDASGGGAAQTMRLAADATALRVRLTDVRGAAISLRSNWSMTLERRRWGGSV